MTIIRDQVYVQPLVVERHRLTRLVRIGILWYRWWAQRNAQTRFDKRNGVLRDARPNWTTFVQGWSVRDGAPTEEGLERSTYETREDAARDVWRWLQTMDRPVAYRPKRRGRR
jgi:hypothetical protein